MSSCVRPTSPPGDIPARLLSSVRQGELPAAHQILSGIHERWRNDETSTWCWSVRLIEAELAQAEGNVSLARTILSRPIAAVPQQSSLEARRHLQLGYLAVKSGKYDDAGNLLRQATSLAGSDSSLQLEIEVAQAVLAQRTMALPDRQRALEAAYRHAVDGNSLYFQAALLNNLGTLRLNQFHYDEAVNYLQRAVETAGRCRANLIASSALGNLAICSYRLGDFSQAMSLRLKAADIQRRVGARDKLQVSLGEFGNIEYLQGRPAAAIPSYVKALSIAREVENHEYTQVWAANLASAYTEVRNWPAAKQTIEQIRRWGAPHDDPRLSAELQFNEAAVLTGQGNYPAALALYNQLLRSKTGDPAVLWQAHANVAAVYVQSGQASAARAHFDQALHIIERTRLSLLQNDYKVSFLEGLIRFYQQYIDLLVNDGDYWKALEIADSSRARTLTEKLGVERTSGSSLLSPAVLAQRTDAVILFYCLQPERSYLWLIANGKVKLLHLPGQEVISNLVKKHQAAIRDLWDPASLALPSSRQLASLLLEPAKPYLNASKKILIIPDGALYDLSFDTLPHEDHYWIDRATIAIAPSLHMLDRKAPAAAERRPLLLIGDPDPQPSGFSKLAYGGAEIKAIQNITRRRPASIHTGVNARPSAYRASSPSQFALIHFTAHVVPNSESPLDSAIILAPDEPDHFKLYARDVLECPLTAELVTVSGCSSAGARLFAGEGLIGFAWAFLRAGAQSVVGGLWDVDDRSTAQIMEAMYSRLESGDKPVRALHDAKLTLRRSADRSVKPYHWAAFQIYIRSYEALRFSSPVSVDIASR